MVKDNFVRQLVQSKQIFYQNEHNSVKDTGEKGKKKKTCNIDLKISMKILFHLPPTFPFI